MKELVELIRKCATDLPADVEAAITQARRLETGVSAGVLDAVLENARIARDQGRPICQDTGTPIFYVSAPSDADQKRIREEIAESVEEATESVPLRANAVDTLSAGNIGSNTAVIHFLPSDERTVRYDLLLKGGGSENVTQLYRLPEPALDAGRDLDGVARCVLDAVYKAQGKGCPPYIIGIGIGGMADTAISLAKRQLLRPLDDKNPEETLASLEEDLHTRINRLDIGPMGLGGKTTALAVKAAAQERHPASYFVGVSFSCWALRRGRVEVPM